MTTTTPEAVELEDEVASHHWQLATAVRKVGTRTGGAGPARTLLVVGVSHLNAGLTSQHHAVTAFLQKPSGNLLRHSAVVDVGGVHEIDTAVQAIIDQPRGLDLTALATERHRSQANARNCQAGMI